MGKWLERLPCCSSQVCCLQNPLMPLALSATSRPGNAVRCGRLWSLQMNMLVVTGVAQIVQHAAKSVSLTVTFKNRCKSALSH